MTKTKSEVTPEVLAKMEALAPNLRNGTFTVSHPDRGHFTVKLFSQRGGALDGKRIVSILVGPDNVADFRGVAFWNDERKVAHVWKRFRGPDSRLPVDGYHFQERGWSSTEQKLAIWLDLALRGEGSHWRASGYEVLEEGRCLICNRPLTHPESIRTGIGPVCAGRS